MPDLAGGTQTSYSPPARIAPRQTSSAKPQSRRYTPPKRRGSGGSSGGYSGGGSSGRSGGGGYSGGGGGGSFSAPKAPSLASYLASDDAYQQNVRGGKRSLADFLSEINRRRGEAGTTFNQTRESMESDRVRQLQSLRDEFASRGLIQSGLYGKEQGRFQEQFATQQRALEQQQAGLLGDLLSQERNFRREQELALEVAKQEALQRRAQRYR